MIGAIEQQQGIQDVTFLSNFTEDPALGTGPYDPGDSASFALQGLNFGPTVAPVTMRITPSRPITNVSLVHDQGGVGDPGYVLTDLGNGTYEIFHAAWPDDGPTSGWIGHVLFDFLPSDPGGSFDYTLEWSEFNGPFQASQTVTTIVNAPPPAPFDFVGENRLDGDSGFRTSPAVLTPTSTGDMTLQYTDVAPGTTTTTVNTVTVVSDTPNVLVTLDNAAPLPPGVTATQIDPQTIEYTVPAGTLIGPSPADDLEFSNQANPSINVSLAPGATATAALIRVLGNGIETAQGTTYIDALPAGDGNAPTMTSVTTGPTQGPGPHNPGTVLDYTITHTNTSAEPLIWSGQVPPGVSYTTVDPVNIDGTRYGPVTLASGDSITYDVQYTTDGFTANVFIPGDGRDADGDASGDSAFLPVNNAGGGGGMI